MASKTESDSEQNESESTNMLSALKEVANDLRDSYGSSPQTSNRSLPVDDLKITERILATQTSETQISSEETTDEKSSTEKPHRESLVDGLNSFSKCLNLQLNVSPTTNYPESQQLPNEVSTNRQPTIQQVNDEQPIPTSSSVSSTTTTTTISSSSSSSVQPVSSSDPSSTSTTTATVSSPVQPVSSSDPSSTTTATVSSSTLARPVLPSTVSKRQHIMISYNSSCREICQRIRKKLRESKYIVWMDVYDMRGNFIEGMAHAVKNSYIVLMCINQNYDDSYWCKKEAEDTCRKRIKFIPCFLEEPFPLEDWLEFLIGSNVRVDFSTGNFDAAFGELIKQITQIEFDLATQPRETPPPTPAIGSTNVSFVNSTASVVDATTRNFKTWVERNQQKLKQFNRRESAQLINQLIQGLQNDERTVDDDNKRQLLLDLLSANQQQQDETLSRIINGLTSSDYGTIKGLLFIMALWAVRVVFKNT